MEKRKISFIGTRNRGITPDLKILHEYLCRHMDDVSFGYLLNNENSKNPMVKKGAKSAKKQYCKNIGDVICVDGSLPQKLSKTAMGGKKILIPVPYDYQFKPASKRKKKTYQSFTHILLGSPFEKDLMEKAYSTPKSKMIQKVVPPFVWSINQEEEITATRKKFEMYFPAAKGKKILSILLTGTMEEEEENPYNQFHWKQFLDSLGEDWFVFINHQDLLESAGCLDSKYKEHFGFVSKMLDARDLLYFSDCLVTNSGMYASYFSSKKKPVYCLQYKENAFEKYMQKHFPALYAQQIEGMNHFPIKDAVFNKENEAFTRYFSYELTENPCKIIMDLLNEM